MIPPKLKAGDHVRVIAPSHSFSSSFTDENKAQAEKGLEKIAGYPIFTLPIGGTINMEVKAGDQVKIEITEH